MSFHRQQLKSSQSRTPRRGLTLVEMLLVLAILGIIAAITWPGLSRVWADHKIQEATEMVRTNLAKTRNLAVDSVLIYEFRYEPGGNHFLVVPHEPSDFLSDDSNIDPQGQAVQANASDKLVRIAGVLREGVQFTSITEESAKLGIPEIEQYSPVAEWQLEGLPVVDELKEVNWSEAILFYPDGSAQAGRVRLTDEWGQVMELSVRGLTGAVTAMPLREDVEL